LRFDLIHSIVFCHQSFDLGGNGGDAGNHDDYPAGVGYNINNARANGGSSYDTTPSVDTELLPGSGGGGGSGSGSSHVGGRGGAGGAAIRLFAVETIKIDGSILSNGENGEGCTNAGSTW